MTESTLPPILHAEATIDRIEDLVNNPSLPWSYVATQSLEAIRKYRETSQNFTIEDEVQIEHEAMSLPQIYKAFALAGLLASGQSTHDASGLAQTAASLMMEREHEASPDVGVDRG